MVEYCRQCKKKLSFFNRHDTKDDICEVCYQKKGKEDEETLEELKKQERKRKAEQAVSSKKSSKKDKKRSKVISKLEKSVQLRRLKNGGFALLVLGGLWLYTGNYLVEKGAKAFDEGSFLIAFFAMFGKPIFYLGIIAIILAVIVFILYFSKKNK